MRYPSRFLRLLACWMTLAACMGGARVQAQKAPEQPLPQDDAFTKLMKQLEPKLNDRIGSPQSHNFHFVVLMNTQAIHTGGDAAGGNPAKWMNDIFKGLLHHYLVPGDMLTLVPFQNHIRAQYGATANARNWNQAYDPKEADGRLMALMPTTWDSDALESRGHDPEGALLEAFKQTQGGIYPIYILMSNDRFAQTSDGGVTLTANTPEFQTALEANHLEMALEGTFPETSMTKESAMLYYRVYLPNSNTLTAPAMTLNRYNQIKTQEQDHQWSDTHPLPPLPTTPAVVTTPTTQPGAGQGNSSAPPSSGTANGSGTDSGKPDPSDDLPGWVPGVIIVVVLMVCGGVFLISRLNARYDVMVDHLSKNISLLQPLQIGGKGNTTPAVPQKGAGGKGAIIAELDQFPANTKVASIKANLGGQVYMEGLSHYTLGVGPGNPKVPLSTTPVTVTVTDSRTKTKVATVKVQRIAHKRSKI